MFPAEYTENPMHMNVACYDEVQMEGLTFAALRTSSLGP